MSKYFNNIINNKKIEKLASKLNLQYESVIKDVIQRFESKDITRISIISGSTELMDKYIDKRQKEVIKESISKEQNRYTLDAGMGAGRWTDFFCNRSEEVIGIDSSIEMLNVAKDNIKKKNVSFIRCSYTKLPFKKNIFSLSFCCFSLLYMVREEDFDTAIKELIRVTELNKKIVIIDITTKKPLITTWMFRRTPSQYVQTFLLHGGKIREIYGYYLDYPFRSYQRFLKKILKFFYGKSKEFNDDFWNWIEKRRGYSKVLVILPVKFILFFMYFFDKNISKKLLQSACSEKVFVFEKVDFK